MVQNKYHMTFVFTKLFEIFLLDFDFLPNLFCGYDSDLGLLKLMKLCYFSITYFGPTRSLKFKLEDTIHC